jgi:N-acetylmuramoyl-L-alanine amidase
VLGRILTWLRANRAIALTLAGTLLTGGTLAIVIDADGPDGPTPPVTFTYKVNAAAGDGLPTRTVAVQRAVVDSARAALDEHLDLRDETPEGVPDRQLDAIDEAVDEAVAEDPLVEGGATSQQRGCRTRFVANQSSRGGVRPTVGVLHRTVMRNMAGELDLNALDGLASRASSQVSWHYAIDEDGNCHYNVPEDRKAWTAAAFNPFGIQIENNNFGTEPALMKEAGYRKLALVVHDISERWGIPLRKGAVFNCVPVRSGWIDHRMLGICGGGHIDLLPYDFDAVLEKVLRYTRELDAPKTNLTVREQRIDRGLTAKAPVSATGHSRRFWCDRAQTQRLTIRRAARATSRGWDRRHRSERFQAISRPYAKACR